MKFYGFSRIRFGLLTVFSVFVRGSGPQRARLKGGFSILGRRVPCIAKNGADGQYRSTSCSPRVRDVRKQPPETENYSRTNFACTLYSSLMVLKSSGSSATAPSAMSADAFMLRMTTALL